MYFVTSTTHLSQSGYCSYIIGSVKTHWNSLRFEILLWSEARLQYKDTSMKTRIDQTKSNNGFAASILSPFLHTIYYLY